MCEAIAAGIVMVWSPLTLLTPSSFHVEVAWGGNNSSIFTLPVIFMQLLSFRPTAIPLVLLTCKATTSCLCCVLTPVYLVAHIQADQPALANVACGREIAGSYLLTVVLAFASCNCVSTSHHPTAAMVEPDSNTCCFPWEMQRGKCKASNQNHCNRAEWKLLILLQLTKASGHWLKLKPAISGLKMRSPMLSSLLVCVTGVDLGKFIAEHGFSALHAP
jgi:hypothetical protein